MAGVDFIRLLHFARELQRALDYEQLGAIIRQAVEDLTGYRHAWLAVFEPDQKHARILVISGPHAAPVWAEAPLIPLEGDEMMAELLRGLGPVVVADARSDPRTNKQIVEAVGNRTIINVPLVLEGPLGALGTGTFGDEGVQPPTAEQLENLLAMANQITVAVGRLRLLQERAAAQRERDELQRRLHHAQKLESLGLLAGGIAHDFNNLLMVIRGHTHFLGESELDASQREDLSTIVQAAERGAHLTRQLLALGRRQPQQLEALDLNQRLRELLLMLARLLPANIAVDLLPGQHLPTLLADAGQLDQVFMNLCVNARDAMPGGGRLTLQTELVRLNGSFVAAHPWAKAGQYVLTTVSDTGSGMSADVLERIFEPFFTTKPAGSGSGLGLAVAYAIVQQHGGLMHAYSEPGVGSSFKIYLPTYERPAETVGPMLSAPVPRGRERILIAEDDAQVRPLLERILRGAGYQVTAVGDGVEAVAAARKGPPFDLVILDAMMPEMSGREAQQRIAELGTRTAFLFSSGYTADLLPTEMLEATGVELLHKPYDPDKLLIAVRRALDGR